MCITGVVTVGVAVGSGTKLFSFDAPALLNVRCYTPTRHIVTCKFSSIYMCTHTHTHMHTHSRTHTHTHMNIHAYT